jgi:hypothetical protein
MLEDHEDEPSTVNNGGVVTSNVSEQTEEIAALPSTGDVAQDRLALALDVGVDDSDTERLCEDLSMKVQLQSETEEEELHSQRFICDLGYGLPKESRPRKEKILAIARQLTNFLVWRQEQVQPQYPIAHIFIVLGKSIPSEKHTSDSSVSNIHHEIETTNTRPDEAIRIQDALFERMREIWGQHQLTETPFPDHTVSFVHDSLEEFLQTTCPIDTGNSSRKLLDRSDVVYLSPDATAMLDVTRPPPENIIIGLLIDRRSIQLNRSYMRAQDIEVQPARLPLDCVASLSIHKSEPLNVDCVLEMMQQWCWNIFLADRRTQRDTEAAARDVELMFRSTNHVDTRIKNDAFERAVIQAMQHHSDRHPQRPLHKTSSTSIYN